MSCFNIPGDMALNADESDFVFVTDSAAVLQQIKNGVQIFFKSWHYDQTKGLTYQEDILVNNPDLRLIRTIYWAFLASVPGVTSVDQVNLSLDRVARILYVKFIVTVGLTQVADSLALQLP